MDKNHKFEIGTEVVINNNAKSGMPNYVGRLGIIECILNKGSYDYVVQFDKHTNGKFKEPELSLPETLSILETGKESPRIQSHRNVIEEIHNVFKIKNSDYGNSFGEQYAEYGLLSAVIRLDDKMRRLKQLIRQEAQVKDESIRDTVLDLANYAIMTVMELDK